MAGAVFLLVWSVLGVTCSASGQETNVTDSAGSRTLIVGALEETGFLSKRKDGTYEGFHKDVLDEISRLTQLDYRIKAPDDGRYGIQQDDGTWLGMVGELVEGKMDMALGLFITTKRESVIDFTKPLLQEHLEMLLKKPAIVQSKWWVPVDVMTVSAFVLCGVAFLLVATVLFVIIRVSPYESRAYSETVGEASRLSTFGHSLWICYSALSWQGVDYSPRSLSGRFLFFFWFGFIVWMLILMTGAVTTFLSVGPAVSSVPIQSFDDLAASDEILPVIVDGRRSEQVFKDSVLASYGRIYDKAIRVTSNMEGMERVRMGGAAFIAGSTFTNFHINRKPCDLISIHDENSYTGQAIGFGLTKDSPLRDKLSLAILNLREDGTVQKLYKKWFLARGGECPNADFPGPRSQQPRYSGPLDIQHLMPIFIEIVIAAILALCIMGIEVQWDKRKSKVPQKTAPPERTTGGRRLDTNV